MDLGQKIQLSRKKNGMSQEDLANILNVSRQAVQKWESGASQPEINKLVQISNVLDVSLDYLLKDIEEPKNVNIANNESNDINSKSKKLNKSRYTAIKVWLIIGCILTPLSFGGSMVAALGTYSLIFLSLYLVTIPICVKAISVSKHATQKSDLIGWGVTAIILLSVIGGIFMLSAGEKDFVDADVIETPKPKVLTEEEKLKLEEEEKRFIEFYYKDPCRNKCLKAKGYLEKSKLDESEKAKCSKFLDEMLKKVDEIETKEHKKAYINNLKQELAPLYKEASKRHLLIGCVSFLIVAVVAVGITVPVVQVNKEQKKKHNESQYFVLLDYLNNYSREYYSPAKAIINELDGYYDLTEEKIRLEDEDNYCLLLNSIANYAGTSSDNNIKFYINHISQGFKDVLDIKEEFEDVKVNVTNIASIKSANDTNAYELRGYLYDLVKRCNDTKHWNFNKYVKTIPIDRIICGGTWHYQNYSFKWTSNSGTDNIYHELPIGSWYNETDTFYFSMYKSTIDNSLRFDLRKSTESISHNLIKFTSVYFYGKEIAADIYNYSTNETNRFIYYK